MKSTEIIVKAFLRVLRVLHVLRALRALRGELFD